jgi:hypothetical protein
MPTVAIVIRARFIVYLPLDGIRRPESNARVNAEFQMMRVKLSQAGSFANENPARVAVQREVGRGLGNPQVWANTKAL